MQIRLIGLYQLNPAAGDYSLIASAFRRLPQEVKPLLNITRLIGFNGFTQGGDNLSFFGIEVDDIEYIPDGMVAWELTMNHWTVWQGNGKRKSILWQEDISWQWFDQIRSDPPRSIGEFIAIGPASWFENGMPEPRRFWLFAHVYIGLDGKSFQDQIKLVDYDPSWPGQYHEMEATLRSKLGNDIALRIEHYGSTAIPGMPAKPVIDILVEVPSFSIAKMRVLPYLCSEVSEYWWYANHMIFIRRKELMGERHFHIHVAPSEHDIWKGLLFRDYLRTHPEEAKRYALLKRNLSENHQNDREQYTQAKTDLVMEITEKARLAFLERSKS